VSTGSAGGVEPPLVKVSDVSGVDSATAGEDSVELGAVGVSAGDAGVSVAGGVAGGDVEAAGLPTVGA
jgi:hypothetical protein